MPQIKSLDHLVLKVADLERTVQFYGEGLGMQVESFQPDDGSTRTALKFGVQKINIHVAGAEYEPKAKRATPGSADLCFLVDGVISDWVARLTENKIDVIEGPVRRTGAICPIMSIYCRDPDGNLIEISAPILRCPPSAGSSTR